MSLSSNIRSTSFSIQQDSRRALSRLSSMPLSIEDQRWPIDLSDPIEAIRFRLEQQGKDAGTPIGIIGNRSRVYEVMRGQRALSLRISAYSTKNSEFPLMF
jgi:antitoxin component HigA of HigAB toxin-antitoxin module